MLSQFLNELSCMKCMNFLLIIRISPSPSHLIMVQIVFNFQGPKVKKQPRNFKVLFKILWMFIKRLADAPPYRWRREWTERGKRNVLRSLSTWAPARDTEAQVRTVRASAPKGTWLRQARARTAERCGGQQLAWGGVARGRRLWGEGALEGRWWRAAEGPAAQPEWSQEEGQAPGLGGAEAEAGGWGDADGGDPAPRCNCEESERYSKSSQWYPHSLFGGNHPRENKIVHCSSLQQGNWKHPKCPAMMGWLRESR